MALVDDIIAELKTISEAFTGVETFIFDQLSSINTNPPKLYPAILIDPNFIDINYKEWDRSFIPRRKRYDMRIFFLDTYKIAQKNSTQLKDKYGALELIADQYIVEVLRRTATDSSKGFDLKERDNIRGTFAFNVHNDRLVQISFRLSFEARAECSTGTFNY